MNRSIVAIPLLAAIWLGSPTRASAQDPEPATPVLTPPRMALPRPVEKPARVAEPRQVEPPAPDRASSDDQQRGRRGGRDNGRVNGRDNGRDNAGGNRRNGPRVAVPRPPDAPRYTSNYRRPPYSRPAYYPPAYYDRWARQTYRWSPLAYAPWSWIYGSVGLSNYGYYSYGNYGYSGYGAYGGYGGYGGYGPYGRSTTFDTGSVRLKIRPRDAEVFVDGYFAGLVDDFDGTFQSLRLEQGGHKIEVKLPGFETLELDIHVQPNRTITLREDLIRRP